MFQHSLPDFCSPQNAPWLNEPNLIFCWIFWQRSMLLGKICFGVQFILIVLLCRFPQRTLVQLASLRSLQLLSLLSELVSLLSAPIVWLCLWFSAQSGLSFLASCGSRKWCPLISRDARRTPRAISASWDCREVKREDVCKVWKMVAGMGQRSTTNCPFYIQGSSQSSSLLPPSQPGLRWACFPSSSLNLTLSQYLFFVPPVTASLYLFSVMILRLAASPPDYKHCISVGLTGLPALLKAVCVSAARRVALSCQPRGPGPSWREAAPPRPQPLLVIELHGGM